MSQHEVTFDDLQRVHELATNQFPHEYLDTGLGAIGLFLNNPPKNASYEQTPTNSVTFASIGVDGIHFGSITDGPNMDPKSPVVVTIPMAFDDPNYIVGESLYDFLCLGCRHGYANVANLHLNLDKSLGYFTVAPDDWFDDRVPGILDLLANELALKPWRNVHTHFHDLQSRFMSSLKFAASTESEGG